MLPNRLSPGYSTSLITLYYSMTKRVIGPRKKPLMQRFGEKVQVNVMNGCWEWIPKPHHTGYAVFWFNDKHTLAHRFSYEQFIGRIPDGLHLDHLCRNRKCVNPFHLEPVTNYENTIVRGSSPMAKNARKTHCIHGHEFTSENTIQRNGGGRKCRRCNNITSNAYQKRKRQTQRASCS